MSYSLHHDIYPLSLSLSLSRFLSLSFFSSIVSLPPSPPLSLSLSIDYWLFFLINFLFIKFLNIHFSPTLSLSLSIFGPFSNYLPFYLISLFLYTPPLSLSLSLSLFFFFLSLLLLLLLLLFSFIILCLAYLSFAQGQKYEAPSETHENPCKKPKQN